MRTQVEVELRRMGDHLIDRGASRNVARFAHLILFVGAEQSRVMPLLHHDEGDARRVGVFQPHARLSNAAQFVLQYL